MANIHNYIRLLGFFSGKKRWLVLSVFLNLIVAAMSLYIPTLSMNLINDGISAGSINTIFYYGILMLLAALIGCVVFVGNTGIAVWAGEYAAHHIRVAEYRKIQELSHGNIDRFRSSDLLIRLTTDVLTVKNAVMQLVLTFPIVPFFLFGTIILIYVNMPSLVGIALSVLICLFALLFVYIFVVQPKYVIKDENIDQVNHTLRESLAGIRVVKAFVNQKHESDKYCHAAEGLRVSATSPQYLLAYITPANTLILFLGITATFMIGGSQVIAGTGMNIGDVTAAGQYLIFILIPVYLLSIILPLITSANASMDRIYEVLDTVPEIQPPPHPVRLDPEAVKGRIVFEHVSFGYRGADGRPEKPVISDIDLTIEPGENIGILGATGCGKTSLVSLIPRFYDVTGGRVTIDGVDVREIALPDLRALIGICQQEPILFSGKVRDTVSYGEPGMSDDSMKQVAKAAGADGFIANIPEGYESYVARRGANFSGGQRQRLAIARALATTPKILILDDSTSACDVVTEGEIQDAISSMMAGVTRITIAQRISSVITADRILIMDSGRIIAQGPHAQLIKTCREYQEIFESQLGSLTAPGSMVP
jgi:ATP-binding cassette subfamily B protein